MTIQGTSHGTEQVADDQQAHSSQSQFQHNHNMSLTYSDFLYVLPPHQGEGIRIEAAGSGSQNQQQVIAKAVTTPTNRDRESRDHRSLGRSGSVSSIFGQFGQSVSHLPNEFQVLEESSVPLLQNAEEKNEDIIIISEFSELEGPIPLCTIPPSDTPESRTDINLNSLSVQLMSTDYQVNTVGHFKVSEDTQVMRTNVYPNVHVFMQYFTLYDIKARGFVRPFCFGYVTKDHVKLEGIVHTLANKFNQISKLLKYSNRLWFAEELSSYMNKLSCAKENFVSRASPPEEGDAEDGHFYFETGEEGVEPISLSQMAHQFTEIEAILKAVQSINVDAECILELNTLESVVNANSGFLKETLNKLNFIGNSFSRINMPLVHPLKGKGESLRPLTTLGQIGVVNLVQELLEIYARNREDVIFTEMTNLTQNFQTHFALTRQTDGRSTGMETPPPAQFTGSVQINQLALCKVIEKLHASVPIISTDDRSDSYHSLSDESDVQFPANREGSDSGHDKIDNEGSPFTSAIGSLDSCTNFNKENISAPSTLSRSLNPGILKHSSSSPSASASLKSRRKEKGKERLPQKQSTSTALAHVFTSDNESVYLSVPKSSLESGSLSGPRLSVDYCSDEDSSHRTRGTASSSQATATDECSEVEIEKIPWWTLAAKTNIVKGERGYGIWKFFRRFYKIGHHILYSILIGRPVIFCGSAKCRPRIRQFIYSLIPLVPCFPAKSFKVLLWHQGTLSPLNFRQSYKLIGLCIPERMDVHDLVHSKEQNAVTVIDFEAKKIMGPAYNGNYFKNFDELVCQKKFFDDLSILTYLGSIFAELESQVFMYKTIQCDGENSVVKITKQLNIKNSDAEIVKHLGSIVAEPYESVELF